MYIFELSVFEIYIIMVKLLGCIGVCTGAACIRIKFRLWGLFSIILRVRICDIWRRSLTSWERRLGLVIFWSLGSKIWIISRFVGGLSSFLGFIDGVLLLKRILRLVFMYFLASFSCPYQLSSVSLKYAHEPKISFPLQQLLIYHKNLIA